MSRAVLILSNADVRKRAAGWAENAEAGSRLELKGPRRSNDQNSLMWAHLTDVSEQAVHMGRKYDSNAWKALFLHALGRETQFIPALDGKTFLPITQSSSDLSKKEMSELLDFIQAFCAEQGITLHAGDMR